MGLFDVFKGRGPLQPAADAPPASGWEAIEQAFDALYPGQKAKHWTHDGVMRTHDLRNPPENPFDGVSIYDGGAFWHYVSFGMSDLYEKESRGSWSGFGYELTFRLAKPASEAEPPLWPINLMGSLARAAYTGSAFAPGHTVQVGPIDGQVETTLTALLLTEDPALPVRDTPNGELSFLLLVGVEAALRERAMKEGSAGVLAELRASDPALMTRLSRASGGTEK
jgi:suppressor of fused-like protein